MRRKGDGWNNDGTKFCYANRVIVKRPNHYEIVRLVSERLQGILRPGKKTASGSADRNSVWAGWLVDFAELAIFGKLLDYDSPFHITEAHIHDAGDLRYPIMWRNGSPEYCVNKRDYESGWKIFPISAKEADERYAKTVSSVLQPACRPKSGT